ncbi:MAG TPA: CopD family protein [Candidatus Udaeobacter sp.]|nr:CopD family protein [Candidatus Udaeobacter sp.]
MITLSAVIRFLHLAASALLLGSIAFRLIVAGPALRKAGAENSAELAEFERKLIRLALWALLAVFCTGLFAFGLQIAAITGASFAQTMSPQVMGGVLIGTRYGIVWLARMVLIVLLAGVLFAQRKSTPASLPAISVVLAAALLMALAFSGHAAAGEGSWLFVQLAADGLHLLASGTWLGGLAAFAWFLLWIRKMHTSWMEVAFKEATRRFSLLGLAAVIILMVTGFLNAWTLVGAVPPLLGTTYGQLLVGKLILLVPLIAVAAVNRMALKPKILALRFESSLDLFRQLLARLKGNVVTEAVLGTCILLIVGAMSVTPPARHIQPDWPLAFRWNWNAAASSAKIRAEMARAKWLAVGGVALIGCAALRRRFRYPALAAGLGILGFGGWTAHNAVSIDSYPATYIRPSVPYNVISVANGSQLYQENCALCHGVAGYGDGPNGQGLKPKPADLTAKHTVDHTAGDLFWWLSYGVKGSPMPGFAASLEEEERWDLINFLRALSYAERARQMAALVEPDPWLVAPDFVYRTLTEESRSLKDHRGNEVVMLALFSLPDSRPRLLQLEQMYRELQNRNVKILAIPKDVQEIHPLGSTIKSLSLVTDGSREAFDTYALFRRSLSEQGTLPDPPIPSHMEFLIDRQGYVRARWIPRDGAGWDKMENLFRDIDRLNQEKPSAPAPDDHVH